jgi:hypothetical protein
MIAALGVIGICIDMSKDKDIMFSSCFGDVKSGLTSSNSGVVSNSLFVVLKYIQTCKKVETVKKMYSELVNGLIACLISSPSICDKSVVILSHMISVHYDREVVSSFWSVFESVARQNLDMIVKEAMEIVHKKNLVLEDQEVDDVVGKVSTLSIGLGKTKKSDDGKKLNLV